MIGSHINMLQVAPAIVRCLILLCTGIVSLGVDILIAEEVLPTPSSLIRMKDRAGESAASRRTEADVEAMEEAMRQLRMERRQLAVRFQANEQATTHAQSSRARTSVDVEEMRKRIEQSRQRDLQRSERINEKLQRLRELVEQGSACAPEPVPTNGKVDSTGQPVTENSAKEAVEKPTDGSKTATNPSMADVPVPPLETVPVNTAGSRFPSFSTTQPDDNNVEVLPVLDQAIDSLRLANNLYGSNEIKLALEIYQRLDKSSLNGLDQLWVEYQIGNCHRRLGNRQESERSFRIVTSRDKSTWIGENARWWLDVADRANRLESQVNSIKQALDQLQEQTNANPINP